jgi:hypothetical protein
MPLLIVTDPNHLPKNALLAVVDFPYLTELEEVTDNLPITIVPSEEVIVVRLLSQKIDSLSYLFFSSQHLLLIAGHQQTGPVSAAHLSGPTTSLAQKGQQGV